VGNAALGMAGRGGVRRLRGDDGQVVPLLLFVILATLAGGWALYEVGKAATVRADAQTAADAAALAGTKNVRDQLRRQLETTGTADLVRIIDPEVRAAAASYAARNGARLTSYERFGVDVRVKVQTVDSAGSGDEAIAVRERRADARARASMSLLPTIPGGGPIGGFGAGGSGNAPLGRLTPIDGDDWDRLERDLGDPPFRGDTDLVRLGRFLEARGIDVSEHPAFGGVAPVHARYGPGDHYNGGAIDLNLPDPGPGDSNEAATFDRVAPRLRSIGFEVLWRVPSHAPGDNSHMHVSIGSGGGGGGGGRGVGGGLRLSGIPFPLAGDATGEVKLVAWEGGPSLLAGVVPASGNPFGPPDLDIACTIVSYAEREGLGDRLLLAAMEAAIVESGVHNLRWGDRDSLGVFQQRPSVGEWGSTAQVLDVDHAVMAFFRAAQRFDRGQPAGQLAQDTQRSAFPERYAQVEGQAKALIAKTEGSCAGGRRS
jgi:hypothetical protein